MDLPETCRYAPFYCEENIWHLAADAQFAAGESQVALISGQGPYRRLWHQRAAIDPQLPVLWDYHVVLISRNNGWQVWDLDTTLGFPVEAQYYIDRTFLNGTIEADETDVLIRLIAVDYYREHFSSDRAHMRLPNGDWSAPPPDWPIIYNGNRSLLFDWLDCERAEPGRVLSLAEYMQELR